MSTFLFVVGVLVYVSGEAWWASRRAGDASGPADSLWAWRAMLVVVVLLNVTSGWPFWLV